MGRSHYVEYDVQYHKTISDVVFDVIKKSKYLIADTTVVFLGQKYVIICNFSAQLGLILDFLFI